MLFISGQIPQTADGHVPAGIDEQCRLIWGNLTAALVEAGMGITNLVKVTTFLSNRSYATANTAVRTEVSASTNPLSQCQPNSGQTLSVEDLTQALESIGCEPGCAHEPVRDPPKANQLSVIVEFPTMEALRGWYDSADYAEAFTVRTDALERRLLFVEGV